MIRTAQSYRPAYTVTTTINDRVIGTFMNAIPDPFARTTVTVGWRDLLRSLLTRRALTVQVMVSADKRTMHRVLEMDPDHLGDTNSSSRKAWNASLQGALESFGSGQERAL